MLKNEPKNIKTIIKMYNNNFTYGEIAKIIKKNPVTISQYINKILIPNKILEKKVRQSFFEKNKNIIIDLYNQGKTYPVITEILECKQAGIRDYIYRRLILKKIVTPRQCRKSKNTI